ncbi:MAG: glycosyltransferase family 9 protein [Leptospiraceae bacterium]|nr:glycosyltransferase family 9 protein [Leptospiraceae bacterium]
MKNILIIQTAFLGDLILTTPFIREVYALYDRPSITIVVNKGTEEILSGNPFLKEVLEFDKKKAKKNLLYFFWFASQLRKRKFDLCLSPHFSHRSSILSFLSRAKERIGYKEAGFSNLLTKKIHRPILGVHEVDKLFSLIYPSIGQYPKRRRPEIYLEDSKTINIKNIMKKENLKQKKYIVIAPSSVWETKKMPKEKFIELIQLILQNFKYQIVLIGSKSDINLSESIQKKGNPILKKRNAPVKKKTKLSAKSKTKPKTKPTKSKTQSKKKLKKK